MGGIAEGTFLNIVTQQIGNRTEIAADVVDIPLGLW
jgi:hypothetical protein